MSGPSGLQPALQLAAVAAAHLAPRSRVSWAPFLQFGMTNPMLFGAPFLTRPHFNGGGHNQQLVTGNNNSQSSGLSPNRTSIQNQQSEDSNDERGNFSFLFNPLLFSAHYHGASVVVLFRQSCHF
jgi:hypothetical protein